MDVNGEAIIIVGATNGAPVIMHPEQWETLRRWKLTRLTFRDKVRGGDGTYCTPLASFFTGIQRDANKRILYKNGNALDLRLSNLVVMARTTKTTREQTETNQWQQQ